MLTEAARAQEQGRIYDAVRGFEAVLKLDPIQAAAWHHLGLLKNQLGAPQEAIEYLQRAIKVEPRDPVCYNNLGNVFRAEGRFDEALEAYKAAIALDGRYVNALFNTGVVLANRTRFDHAIGYLEQASRLSPRDVQIWEEIGRVYLRLQKTDAAERAFNTALAIEPRRADSYHGLGGVSLARGEVEQARKHYLQALEIEPGHKHALEFLTRSRKFTLDDREEIDRVEAMLEAINDEQEACVLHFVLGKMYDDCKLYDQAFHHYAAGNQIRHADEPFDADAVVDKVSRIIEVFSAEFFAERRDFGCDSQVPMLVMGLPRSGTTLVEQIIASHPSAAGAGEVPYLGDLIGALGERVGRPFPECVLGADQDVSAKLAAAYIDRLQQAGPDSLRITDKAISGCLEFGLFALLFPKGRAVYCQRDLLSTGLSIFFQRFAKGSAQFANDLRGIGVYCNQYTRVMNHWRKVLPIKFHEVQYEDVVNDQETTSRALIEYAGLDWDDQCLSFHETKRSVHTASQWQVRQPIYKHSVNRAEAYRKYLGPMMNELTIADQ